MYLLFKILVCFLLFGWIIIAGIIACIQSMRENEKKNYGYPYLGFNNAFMDGFE